MSELKKNLKVIKFFLSSQTRIFSSLKLPTLQLKAPFLERKLVSLFDRLQFLVTNLTQILNLNLSSFNLLSFLEQDRIKLRFNDLFIIMHLFPGGF